jgi:hypothetical protein
MDPVLLIPLTAIVCIFGIPVWSHHQRKMLELRLKMGKNVDANVLAEIKSLREQMAEMRDTTTRYDMSFDAALQRIESRVGHLEGRMSAVESTQTQHISS